MKLKRYHSSAEQKENSRVLRIGNVSIVDSDAQKAACNLVILLGGVYLLKIGKQKVKPKVKRKGLNNKEAANRRKNVVAQILS